MNESNESGFFQPVAGHIDASSYLIVRDTTDRWFLWVGRDDESLIEIPKTTAAWIRQRPEVEDIPAPLFWFEVSSLPLTSQTSRFWQIQS